MACRERRFLSVTLRRSPGPFNRASASKRGGYGIAGRLARKQQIQGRSSSEARAVRSKLKLLSCEVRAPQDDGKFVLSKKRR
jgi:hypothetical protein